MLLENGADPLIVVEGEKLYHYVLSCSQDDMGDLADYRGRFLDLIEEYVEEDPLQILFDELSQHVGGKGCRPLRLTFSSIEYGPFFAVRTIDSKAENHTAIG